MKQPLMISDKNIFLKGWIELKMSARLILQKCHS
jgi:hypothetical protein